jgi:stage II sporulation SpoAA-like protein
MGVKIVDTSDGLLTVEFTGLLRKPELEQAQKAAIDLIQKHGKVSVLALEKDFQGWDKQGNWGDLSFQSKYDKHIEKIAIVGEKKWEDWALAFTAKGFRPVEIEYFLPAELAKARAWLGLK